MAEDENPTATSRENQQRTRVVSSLVFHLFITLILVFVLGSSGVFNEYQEAHGESHQQSSVFLALLWFSFFIQVNFCLRQDLPATSRWKSVCFISKSAWLVLVGWGAVLSSQPSSNTAWKEKCTLRYSQYRSLCVLQDNTPSTPAAVQQLWLLW